MRGSVEGSRKGRSEKRKKRMEEDSQQIGFDPEHGAFLLSGVYRSSMWRRSPNSLFSPARIQKATCPFTEIIGVDTVCFEHGLTSILTFSH